jgi:hypothetical protein
MSFTNRKQKYIEEKMTATLKSKQTSIAIVRYHLLPVASLLTPLIFHCPLPLTLDFYFSGPALQMEMGIPHRGQEVDLITTFHKKDGEKL